MSSDEKVHAAGSDNLVTGMVSDVELYRKAKACIKSHATEESDGYATTHAHALAYPHLPCSPSSTGWKQLGTHTVRGILKDMLVCAGYGRGKGRRSLVLALPPVGWPAEADWATFKGSTRSGLKVAEVTGIIASMFQSCRFFTRDQCEASRSSH